MNFKIYICISFIFCLLKGVAQTCCSGGIPLSNSIGLEVSEKGTLQIGLNYDYNNLNTLNSGSETLDDNARLRITHSTLLNVGYSITNHLSIEGLFTWVNQRRKITQFDNENLDQSSGIGDAILLAKYNFNNGIGQDSDLGIGIGTKIPLGSSTETNALGITLNADLQPGSNAWDIIYLIQASKRFKFRPSLTFSSRLIYRDTGINNSYFETSTYRFGNEFQAYLGASDQFVLFKTLFNPSLTFKYRDARIDEIGGFELNNTGGNWLFIIPNISFNLTPDIVFSTKVELPIYSYVDGTQLTPTYRITAGVLIKIAKKQGLINLN